MKKSTFSILFYIKQSRMHKNGETPIIARITLNKVRSELQLKRTIMPSKWSSTKERATGRDPQSVEINDYLISVKVTLLNIHRELEQEQRMVGAELIKRRFLGIEDCNKTLLEIFISHNEEIASLVGNGFSQKTADRYDTSYRHMKEFLKSYYNRNDISIAEVSYDLISKFEVFLKTEKECSHNSAMKHMKALKKIVRIAVLNEWIKRNPFENYKIKEEPVNKVWLTEVELQKIVDKEISIQRLEIVRDIFIFCCYTNLW